MLRRESDRVSVRFVQEYKNIYTQIARESCRRNETLERKKDREGKVKSSDQVNAKFFIFFLPFKKENKLTNFWRQIEISKEDGNLTQTTKTQRKQKSLIKKKMRFDCFIDGSRRSLLTLTGN
jgi:hypothetical protein